MDGLKAFSFFLAGFVFIVALALTGRTLTFYFKNTDMYHKTNSYTKEYVLMDSTDTKRTSKNTSMYRTYGFSKEFDNYKTTFDLNPPDGSAVFENTIIVLPVEDSLNSAHFHYYAWVNKEKRKGYIANADEKSVQENWIFLEQIFYFKLNIAMYLFSLAIFYWLKVPQIFRKAKA